MSYLRNLDVWLVADGERLLVNAPKGTLTVDLRSQIAERKAEILKFLSHSNSSKPLFPPPIAKRTMGSPAPLSFAQERLWFLEQLEPSNSAYNICRAARVTGPLNKAAIESSLNEIVRRQQALRTTFQAIDGRPVQAIAPEAKVDVRVVDLCGLSTGEREQQIQRLIFDEALRPFDLTAALLLRAKVLQLGKDDTILVLATHHIVSDAWSMGILSRELWTLYQDYAGGRSPSLEDLRVQYADYAHWQREWLKTELAESQLSYWKRRLDNSAPVLNLPTDYTRPSKQSFAGASVPFVFPNALTAALHELSHREGVTLFMTLLAAFKTLLFRYTGQADILVGSPVGNRNRSEIEGLIGFFVNTTVLRTNLSGNPTFKELLSRIKDTCLGVYVHQDLPFEKVVEALHPVRDMSCNPLFQVMFQLQNAPRHVPNVSGLTIERIAVESSTSKFDLTLALAERDGKLSGFIEYNTDLFRRSRIERMLGHFQTLLEGIVADPDQPISTLPLLMEKEKHQLLVEWNDTAADYPKDSCIHELFESQVERTPETIAVEFEGKQLTYRELNSRANQLAHYLQGLGVGPEKLVGICVDRSLEMVVGLLGILKAGGAYVPLDPGYPRERLRFMFEDAGISLLLTQERIIEDRRLKPVLSPSTKFRIDSAEGIEDSDSRSSILDSQMKMVCLDTAWEIIARESEQNLSSEVKSNNLAYVIYTSGSTGRPKGVQIQHRSVVNCLFSVGQQIKLSEQDTWLAVTTISFDIAVLELFLPLVTRAKVVLANREETLDGAQLLARLKASAVTVMQATPATWKMLIATGWKQAGDFKILCGSEALPRELADQLLQRGGPVWNLYGPTETAIWSTMAKVEPGEKAVTIGRPVANTKLYILDSHLQLVPVGVHGELYIGGDGLARGYLNRPELTDGGFVPNPFGNQPESLLYRTGDLACYRPDGNIEFLGRVDNQVKIRGHRIELGEIEAVLNQHPDVRQSVVVAREDVLEEEYESGNLKSQIQNLKSGSLVAYIVRNAEQPSASELRDFLKGKLPEFMLPSVFIPMNALPLAPNGKIDRSALPPPDGGKPELDDEFVEPRTEIEELVAQVWRDVLKLDKIGVYDNFFELGGHSILAIHIVSRLRDHFNREVHPRVLFEKPTVATLAGEIEQLIRGGSAPELPPIIPVPRNGPLPLSMNQEQLWRLDKVISGTDFFNMPYVYQLSGNLNVEALEQALKGSVHRHEALRTVFSERDGNPVQVVRDGSDFQLLVVDLRKESPDESIQRAASLILQERKQPFNLAIGPLIRAKLLRLTEVKSFLLLTLHHIIGDHWSMQVLRRELNAVYESMVQGRPSELPSLGIQFGDFASWERQLIGGDLMMRQLAYWKAQLSEPLPKLEFQKVRRRRTRSSDRRVAQEIEITGALLAAVNSLATRENCSISMVILTALTMLLYFYTHQTDIRIGTLIANRRRSETEVVFGYFLNTVVIRIQISPDMTCTKLLKDVRAATLDAYAHQELPFEKLAQVLEEEQNVDRSSLFQVLYNYQKIQSETQRPTGMALAPFPVGRVVETSGVVITAIDMIFDLRESSTMLTVSVNCRSGVLDESQIVQLNEDLTNMLKALILPETRVESACAGV
jgi:amino acid adenylation domain-containing protein